MDKDISGRVVLLIWSGMSPPEDIEEIVGKLKEKVGTTGCVNVEHVDRLKLSAHTESTFDIIYSGFTYPTTFIHTMDFLGEVARILKPSGTFHLREPTAKASNMKTEDKLISTMKLSGFVNISKATAVDLVEEQLKKLEGLMNVDKDLVLTEISCEKPSYDVGSSSQLKLSFNKSKETSADKAAKVWTLTAQDMNDTDVDIMDSDDLLDENDYKKPDPASLKSVCGPNSGKKKACKNCTCGLADDLAQGIEGSQPKSACGSCYLGDAFRCASCPYLGMPAFKPGEKISLSDRQLKPDL